MTSPSQTKATILAHHLYDFAECEHRITLDVSLDKSRRTPPDHATELLFERGRRFEREVVAPLGYPAVDVREADWDAAFEETLELMRAGVAGIDQGVLIDGARLARPDLLERVDGRSELGDHYYRPGDVKSARRARSDAALQVGFAGLLLEKLQGRRPESGFLILGDGRREEIDLEAIRYTVEDAVARAEAIAGGLEETRPFYSAACGRCRWRGECVPRLQEGRDLSFVHGLTRSRCRVLRRNGVGTIDDLAVADLATLVAAGVPGDGLERAQLQARALLQGRALGVRRVTLPRGRGVEALLRIDVDPLDGGEALMVAWGERTVGAIRGVHVRPLTSPRDRSQAFEDVVQFLESPALRDEPVFTYGSGTIRALDAMAVSTGFPAARLGDIAARTVDLAPWVRRAGVFPVFHYRFDEIAAVARGTARPSPASGEDAAFVVLAAAEDDAELRARLVSLGGEAIESLGAIRSWLERAS